MLIFVIISMIFCHIVDDYYLQGWLSQAKQKSYWKNAPDEMYKHDYIVALVMHAMSWSFMIMLPIAIYWSFNVNALFAVVWTINAIIHAIVDDLKANKKIINLVYDQSIHMIQIALTAMILLH